MPIEDFGYLLRKYRKMTGVKIQDIISRVNVSRRTYYMWEEGRYVPNREHVKILATLFSERLPGESYEKILEELLRAYDRRVGLETAEELGYYDEDEEEAKSRIGRNLYEDVRRKNISVRELSEKTGIEEMKLMDMMTGLILPTLEEAEKIAEVLGTSIERYVSISKEEMLSFLVSKSPRIRRILTELVDLDEKKKEAILEVIEKLIEAYKK